MEKLKPDISEKQTKILAFPYSKYDVLIADGAIRTGKTTFIIISLIEFAMKNFNHHNFAICAKTIHSAIRNIIKPMQEIAFIKRRYNIKLKLSSNLMTITRGKVENTFYIFGGKDESSFSLIQGITLAGAMLDEVALMPKSFVEQTIARCSIQNSKIFFNCNPASPNHWFYTDFILKTEEKNILHLHFDIDDNPYLSENIKQRYKSMYTGVFYDRYIRG